MIIKCALPLLALLFIVGCSSTTSETTTAAPAKKQVVAKTDTSHIPLPESLFKKEPQVDRKRVVVKSSAQPPVVARKPALKTVETTPKKVVRVTPDLPQAAMELLDNFDSVVRLSNKQYNQMAEVLERRRATLTDVRENASDYSEIELDAKKKAIHKEYRDEMFAILTPNQVKLWQNRPNK